jgi:hypothetical protein
MQYNGSDNLGQGQGQGQGHRKQQYNSNIQLDRNTPEILDAFKSNPYTHSLTHVP